MTKEAAWMTPANGVTLVRVLLTWPVVQAIRLDRPWLALGLFLTAAATDGLDGYLARRRNEVSTLGKLLDPVADKVLGLGVLLVLTVQNALPEWMFWALLVKEALLLLGGVLLLVTGHKVTAARPLGKVATVVLFVGFAFTLPRFALGVPVVGAGVALSLGAGVDYAREAWRALKEGS